MAAFNSKKRTETAIRKRTQKRIRSISYMNLNDKNIDQLFRKGAENMEAPEYNDAYWDEMSQIIDADAKSRKKLMVWIFSGTLGAALVLLLLFLNTPQNNKSNSTIASTDKNSDEQQVEQSTSIQNQAQQSIEQLKNLDKSTQKNSSELKKQNNTLPIFKDRPISTSTSENSPKTSVKSGNLNSLSKTNNELTSNSANESKNKSYKADDSHLQQKPTLSTTPSGDNENTSDEFITDVNMLPIKLITFETNDKVSSDLISLKNLMNRWRVSYHAEAAFGVSESYQNNTKSPWRYSLTGMVRFEYSQLVINTGVGVQVESPANLQVTERAKVYGFGLKSYENILNYKSFTQLFIPLEIGYKSNNSTFGLGGQFHAIVGTKMSFTSKVNNVITAQNDFKNHLAGLNRYSGNFYLWIDQQLTDKISAGVRVGSAVGTRIADSHYFNKITNEQPIFGQLTLKYQLFK